MRCRATAIIFAAIMLAPTAAYALPEIGAKGNGYSIQDERYLHTYKEGDEAGLPVGRNLLDWTWDDSKPRVSDARIGESLATIERWLNPPEPAPVVDATEPVEAVPAPAESVSGGAVNGSLEAIAQCESGGDYGAVNPSSGAYGKYQIMPGTADAYGCDLSTPAGQDACASEIYAAEGGSAWVC